MRGYVVGAGLAIAVATMVGNAMAQSGDYPSKPIRVIAPIAAGGGTDLIARFQVKGGPETPTRTPASQATPGPRIRVFDGRSR